MATRGSQNRLRAQDLARILCAVDERVMMQGLLLRQELCPTTFELLDKYLELALFILGIIPGSAGTITLIRLLVRLIKVARGLIARFV